jgi:hypothetical protein
LRNGFIGVLLLLFFAGRPADAQNIGTINYPGAKYTAIYGINNFGVIVGAYILPDGSAHAFMLSQGTFTNIDDPLGNTSYATGINDVGDVVGQYYNPVLSTFRG